MNIKQKLKDFMNSCKEEIEILNNSYKLKDGLLRMEKLFETFLW